MLVGDSGYGVRLSTRDGSPARLPGARSLLIGAAVAGLTLYAIQPAWWADPVEGVRRFLASNLSRSATKPIPTWYLGRPYAFALPWHNTIVLTFATTPLSVLLLAAVGGIDALRRRRVEPWALIWPLSWATLMVVRALPNAPGHDGIRLFLPSVASLGVLAAMGVGAIARRRPKAALLALALALGESGLGITRVYPYTDSYYSVAVGGLPGAEKLGLELTYYWDAMGPEFLRWLRIEAARRPVSLRFPGPLINVRFLREWGWIPPGVRVLDIEPAPDPDYVLQRRRGVYYPYDEWLDARGQPRFTIAREGVDLLRVYPFSESFRAYEATRGVPIPEHLRN